MQTSGEMENKKFLQQNICIILSKKTVIQQTISLTFWWKGFLLGRILKIREQDKNYKKKCYYKYNRK